MRLSRLNVDSERKISAEKKTTANIGRHSEEPFMRKSFKIINESIYFIILTLEVFSSVTHISISFYQ